jgi:hypothetical protein
MLPRRKGAAALAVDEYFDTGRGVRCAEAHVIGRAFIAERCRTGAWTAKCCSFAKASFS